MALKTTVLIKLKTHALKVIVESNTLKQCYFEVGLAFCSNVKIKLCCIQIDQSVAKTRSVSNQYTKDDP